jgi:hypothetical protein
MWFAHQYRTSISWYTNVRASRGLKYSTLSRYAMYTLPLHAVHVKLYTSSREIRKPSIRDWQIILPIWLWATPIKLLHIQREQAHVHTLHPLEHENAFGLVRHMLRNAPASTNMQALMCAHVLFKGTYMLFDAFRFKRMISGTSMYCSTFDTIRIYTVLATSAKPVENNIVKR